jgi:hypothetical protein
MRGIAFALVALTFAATTPDPVAAQCYGPECDRRQPGPQPYYGERPNFPSSPHQMPPQAQPYRSTPYDQTPPYGPAPYEQPQSYQQQMPQSQQQPTYQQPAYPQPNYQRPAYQTQPTYQQRPAYQTQPAYQQRPAYQTQPAYQQQPYQVQPQHYQVQPQHPTRYSHVPPGYRPTKTSAVRHYQPAPGSRVMTTTSPQPGSGQITISVAEYRALQNQARQLQRMRSARPAGPHRSSPFPPAPGTPPKQQ